MSSIAQLLAEAASAVSAAQDLAALDAVRVHYLGKKGVFTAQLREIGKLPSAEIPVAVAQEMMEMALAAHRLLGCRGASRSDFRWDDTQGEAGVYLLEVNTQPGMTPLSLVPEQARQKGISYGELVERIIAEALDNVPARSQILEGVRDG